MNQKILAYLALLLLCFGPRISNAQNTGTPGSLGCEDYFHAYRLSSTNFSAIDSATACFGNAQQVPPNQCAKQFMFSCYQDEGVLVTQDASSLPVVKTYILYTPPNGVADTIWQDQFGGYQQYPLDVDGNGQPRLRVGIYKLLARTFDPQFGWFDYGVGIITVIPKVRKVWIDAPEICADDFLQAGQNYKFYIKTDLNLADTMFPAPVTLGQPNCTPYESYQYLLNP